MANLIYTRSLSPLLVKYPHRVKLSPPSSISIDDYDNYYIERLLWCQANIANDWRLASIEACLYFTHEHDALMFMLRWQGE
jgi:hypothetical protein